jgi:hypothetical protein
MDHYESDKRRSRALGPGARPLALFLVAVLAFAGPASAEPFSCSTKARDHVW